MKKWSRRKVIFIIGLSLFIILALISFIMAISLLKHGEGGDLQTKNVGATTGTVAELFTGELADMKGAQSVTVWVDYGTNEMMTNHTPTQNKTTTGEFQIQVSGLQPDTIYYWRVTGTGNFANGNKPTGASQMSKIKTAKLNAWDVNGDGKTNVLDMISVIGQFMKTGYGGWIYQDVNGDGVVNVLDLIVISQHMN